MAENLPKSVLLHEIIEDIIDETETFESVSKNIKNFPYVLNYTGDTLTSIVYDLGGGDSITKTFSGNTIVLSGDTPSGITLTKTFNYTDDKITSVSYS